MNVFHWAGKFPKRVGMPKRNASYDFMMLVVMIG